MVANIDSISAYKLPSLDFQWALQTRSYFKDLGNVVFLSQHTISVAGKYDTESGLKEVIFSTLDQIYTYDIISKDVTSLWEKTECYILELGISVSPNGDQIVVTISTVYSNVLKQFGLMLLDMEGGWEVLDL